MGFGTGSSSTHALCREGLVWPKTLGLAAEEVEEEKEYVVRNRVVSGTTTGIAKPRKMSTLSPIRYLLNRRIIPPT
jgi:hypothetical protein